MRIGDAYNESKIALIQAKNEKVKREGRYRKKVHEHYLKNFTFWLKNIVKTRAYDENLIKFVIKYGKLYASKNTDMPKIFT